MYFLDDIHYIILFSFAEIIKELADPSEKTVYYRKYNQTSIIYL